MARAKAPKSVYDTLWLIAYAGDCLKRAGFVHAFTARNSESTYYKWPGHETILRVSCHSTRRPPHGVREKVAGKITFTGNCHDRPGTMRINMDKVGKIIALGVGAYFLKSGDPTTKIDASI